MDIDGLIIAIDRLGRSIAQAEGENVQLRRENAALRQQLAEAQNTPAAAKDSDTTG